MKKFILLASALAFAASSSRADLQPGDLVLVYPTYGASNIQAYGAGGSLNLALQQGDSSWISAALMPDGRIVVHKNSGLQQLIFLDQDGSIHSSFQVTVTTYASDIDTYANGEIAMCVRSEGIRVYDDQGVLLRTLAPAGMVSPMGCQVQSDQTIWVADRLDYPTTNAGRVFHLDVAGNLITTFETPFSASDVATAPDGTLWVIGNSGQVAHYQADGTSIAQWDATIDSSLKSTWSLAVDGTGTVWISGHYDSMVRGYDSSGNVLQEFDTTAQGNSTFSFMLPGSSWIEGYCYGDGSSGMCPCANNVSDEAGCANSWGGGAELRGVGSPDALADNLSFQVSGLIPNEPVLLFVADDRVSSGDAGFMFGDGLRCADGNLTRLGVRLADSGGGASWPEGLRARGGWGPGEVRRFQAWYRDPAGSPCASGFNLSNGLEVTFLP